MTDLQSVSYDLAENQSLFCSWISLNLCFRCERCFHCQASERLGLAGAFYDAVGALHEEQHHAGVGKQLQRWRYVGHTEAQPR
jgi:hypothetical protein